MGSGSTGYWWNLVFELIKVNKGPCPHGFTWNVRKSSLRQMLVVSRCQVLITDQYVLTLEQSNNGSASVHYWHPHPTAHGCPGQC